MRNFLPQPLICVVVALLAGSAVVYASRAHHQTATPLPTPLVTGKLLSPQGQQIPVGCFPAALAASPDGKWLAVTTTGYREYLTILSAADGHVVSQVPFNRPSAADKDRQTALYVGLAFGRPANDHIPLYVSRGPEDQISVYAVDGRGRLTDTGKPLEDPSGLPKEGGPNFIAGLALSADGSRLYAAHNATSAWTGQAGSIGVLDTRTGKQIARVLTPAYPYAVAAVTRGPHADQKIYVSSERDAEVAVITVADPPNAAMIRTIPTGEHPICLLLDRGQSRLFVANAGSDTVSEIDTDTDRVVGTIRVTPEPLRGIVGATPTGLALSPDESRLYVTLADLNAIAVVHLQNGGHTMAGFIPTGWYPTAVVASADGGRLFIANAKGTRGRNPNAQSVGPGGQWGQYIESILEGTIGMMSTPADEELSALSEQVATNNRLDQLSGSLTPRVATAGPPAAAIKHVIYVIKENRTYDQVLGDLAQGNGSAALTLFGRDITPNQHALAERFVLLDNFYCAGEVSADGWNWCSSGMGSEYTERNVPFNYSGRGGEYDYEGANHGTPVDMLGLPDVARAPGGYLWDACAKQGVSYRAYGIFNAFGAKGPGGRELSQPNAPTKRALASHTDGNYLRFAMEYADSDAWKQLDCPAPKQQRAYGRYDAPSRIAEWMREFRGFVRRGSMPRLTLLRLPRDHTAGTSPGLPTPRAMVADNDYAVGELVEAVSHSPYWKDTAIFIVEDDAQDGHDHVDAHRSTCYVVSPYVERSAVDHNFYNTDSVLRTIEAILGLRPMCQYDATAAPIAVFTATPQNAEPYGARLPAKEIVAEVNTKAAYRARDSERMDFSAADRAPEEELNEIIERASLNPEPRFRNKTVAERGRASRQLTATPKAVTIAR